MNEQIRNGNRCGNWMFLRGTLIPGGRGANSPPLLGPLLMHQTFDLERPNSIWLNVRRCAGTPPSQLSPAVTKILDAYLQPYMF